MKACFTLIVLITALGCENSVDEGTLYDYSLEQQLGCFCVRGGVWVKIFVKADTVANALVISDGSQLPPAEWRRYKTIDGLFEVMSRVDTAVYDLRVTMDSVNQFPSYIYFNPKPIIHGDTVLIVADAQMSYTTKNYIARH